MNSFEIGWEAYRRGEDLEEDNPMEKEDLSWLQWRNGWLAAEWANNQVCELT